MCSITGICFITCTCSIKGMYSIIRICTCTCSKHFVIYVYVTWICLDLLTYFEGIHTRYYELWTNEISFKKLYLLHIPVPTYSTYLFGIFKEFYCKLIEMCWKTKIRKYLIPYFKIRIKVAENFFDFLEVDMVPSRGKA